VPRFVIKALKEKAKEKNLTTSDFLRLVLAEVLEREEKN
jgi:hypothetical protein